MHHTACHERHASGRRSPVSGGPPSPALVYLFVCLLVCLLVCLFARWTSKKVGTNELIDWQCPTLALHCAYVSTPISTPSVPPRVQVPHAHLRYCGVMLGTHRDEDRQEHRLETLARTRRARASGACGGGRARSPRWAAERLPHAATRTEHYSTGLAGRTTWSAQSARARSSFPLLGRCRAPIETRRSTAAVVARGQLALERRIVADEVSVGAACGRLGHSAAVWSERATVGGRPANPPSPLADGCSASRVTSASHCDASVACAYLQPDHSRCTNAKHTPRPSCARSRSRVHPLPRPSRRRFFSRSISAFVPER
jgi:hypothetical protein